MALIEWFDDPKLGRCRQRGLWRLSEKAWAKKLADARIRYALNKPRHAALTAANYQKNKEARLKYSREYYERTKERKNAREKERRASDILFRLRRNIRVATRKAVKFGWSNPGRTNKMLGCTPAELKAHIESKFLPGMTWENYGFRGWHIDHIHPLAGVDLTNQKEAARVLHYTNLQPLWWKDNISKGNRIVA